LQRNNLATLQNNNHATLQSNNYAMLQHKNHATITQSCNATIMQPCNATIMQPCNATITQPCSATIMQPCKNQNCNVVVDFLDLEKKNWLAAKLLKDFLVLFLQWAATVLFSLNFNPDSAPQVTIASRDMPTHGGLKNQKKNW
jgi:hypothetical protein